METKKITSHILKGIIIAVLYMVIDFIVEKFEESINELIDAEVFPAAKQNGKLNGEHKIQEVPPVHGAKLGKDKDGNPAWFITDPNRPGKYLQVN